MGRREEDSLRGTSKTSEDEPLLVVPHLSDSGSLQALPDPVTLLQRVDEHELHSNVLAVCCLQTVQDLPEISYYNQIIITEDIQQIQY